MAKCRQERILTLSLDLDKSRLQSTIVINDHQTRSRNSDERVTVTLAILLNARNLSTLQFDILYSSFSSRSTLAIRSHSIYSRATRFLSITSVGNFPFALVAWSVLLGITLPPFTSQN